MWQYNNTYELYHYGILGMKWGKRKKQYPDDVGTKVKKQKSADSFKEKILASAYNIGVQLAPREYAYALKRLLNNPNQNEKSLAENGLQLIKDHGVLPSSSTLSKAIESVGIEKHKQAKYNLNDTDLERIKAYTNAARYSRNINSYLAIGAPPEYSAKAESLKKTLSKANVDDTVVFRTCSLKFSFNGIAKKLDQMSEAELAKSFANFSKNYKGKTFKENRVFSTSTSPNFAVDTWRKINPTASEYNTYMVINTKKCPGILADGRTTDGKKLVNTRSNQEGILAPTRMKYESLKFDSNRNMFAITVTAMGEEDD